MNNILSPFTGNGMIMQRDSHFPLFGKEKFSASFLNKTYEAQKVNNQFKLTLDPVNAGGPYEINISSESGSFLISDVYAGDIWFCSGQSNMEMQMLRLLDDFPEEWKNDNFPLIRQFKVPQEWDFSALREELTGGSWLSLSKDTLSEFTATGYFFAKNLYEKYRIPIGLVSTAWGGTPVESWMSFDALSDFPSKLAEIKQYALPLNIETTTKNSADAINEWEKNLTHEDVGFQKSWQKPETDISGWNEINLPGNFSDASDQTPELNGFCGVIWLVKDFNVSADFASGEIKIWLGTIIDADTVYINGTQIGNTGYRYPPRKYLPKDLIKQGKNRIVIRVTCNNGEGGLTSDKPFKIFTDNESIELKGAWKYKIGYSTQTRPAEFFFQRLPAGNFNAMINPLLKYPVKGVIWYQGESNESNAHEYEQLFKLMILDWRLKNNNEKLPFLFVQLPVFLPLSDNNEQNRWAQLREAQRKTLEIPHTGIACALELGEWNDIHPINKKDVGYRLFLAAEKTVNGVYNTSPGPVVRSFERKQDKIFIYFDNCGEGLKNKTFVSLPEGGKQIRLLADITEKDCICIDVSAVKNPEKILYAWADNPRDRQLVNSDGLPALPFKIEI